MNSVTLFLPLGPTTRSSMQFSRILLLVTLFLMGCSKSDRPELGTVYGVVKIDGKPTSGVIVAFAQKGFRASRGLTNEDGEYELRYLRDVRGATIGQHKVKLDYYVSEESSGAKRLPERYNRKSELYRDVKSGENEINFEITSE